MFTPERHLPTPGQRGHRPQRHTATGTAAPHHHSHGEHSPRARQLQSNGLCSPQKGGPGPRRSHAFPDKASSPMHKYMSRYRSVITYIYAFRQSISSILPHLPASIATAAASAWAPDGMLSIPCTARTPPFADPNTPSCFQAALPTCRIRGAKGKYRMLFMFCEHVNLEYVRANVLHRVY